MQKNINKFKSILHKKGIIFEDKYSNILYSKETIMDNINSNCSLYENFKFDYESSKDFNKIKDNEDYIERYFLHWDISNATGNKHAIVILMNPAFATSKKLDGTLTNVEKYLKKLGYKSFEVLNLYPVRTPKPKCLNCIQKFLEKNNHENKYREVITEYLKDFNADKNTKIIAAWGSDKKTNKIAKDIVKNLKIKFYCYAINKDKTPRHFCSLAFNKKDKFDELKPFNFI